MIAMLILYMGQIEFHQTGLIDLAPHEIYTQSYDAESASLVALSDDGTICILDENELQMVFIRPDGSLGKRVGREGKGPGEFKFFGPSGITWIPGEKVFAVMDWGNRRVSKFSPSGELISEFHAPRFADAPNYPNPKTLLYISAPNGQGGEHPRLMAFDIATQTPSTVWEYVPEKPIELTRGGNFVITFNWDPILTYGMGSDFIAIAFGSTKQIHMVGLNGKAIGAPIKAELRQFPVTDEQIAEQLDTLDANQKPIVKQNLVRPEFWPSILKIIVDRKDRIWAFGPRQELASPWQVNVFDRQGHLLGKGELPTIPALISEDTLYYISPDKNDDVALRKLGFNF